MGGKPAGRRLGTDGLAALAGAVERAGGGQPTFAASIRSATLTFGDDTTIPVGAVLATPDRPTVVSFMPRVTRSVRLTIDQVLRNRCARAG